MPRIKTERRRDFLFIQNVVNAGPMSLAQIGEKIGTDEDDALRLLKWCGRAQMGKERYEVVGHEMEDKSVLYEIKATGTWRDTYFQELKDGVFVVEGEVAAQPAA